MRVISITLITLFHSLCFYTGIWWYLSTDIIPLWKIIATPTVKLGLSMFFCISGFLFGYLYIEKKKYKQAKLFFNSKAKRLLIPYFFWGGILIISMPSMSISWTSLFTGPFHLWFLLSLFLQFVIIFLLTRYAITTNVPIYNNVLLNDGVILLFSFLPLYIWRFFSNHHFFLCIEDTFYYLPTFIIGFYSAKYNKFNLINLKIAFSLLSISIIWMIFLSIKEVPSNHSLYRVPSIIVALCSFVICKNIHLSKKTDRVILFIDKHGMGIYIFNQIVIFLVLLTPCLNSFLSNQPYYGPVVLFFISFLIPLALSWQFKQHQLLSWMIGESVS